jgi:ABC-type multidrug transport system fused ATPase/permease subunit
MDELIKHTGTISKNGSIAYISQEAFLLNDTIRNNILFGKDYDEDKYLKTIELSELESDLNILPGRDFTQIGERGINLSGGQK